MDREGKYLVKRHAFGARGDVKSALGWLDEGTLMYPVGKAIALHTIATNNQRFLEASYQSSGITALAASANKKFIAVAEGGENPQIQIIDTTTRKRRKILTVPELGSDRFIAMAFSADGRHLVTQGGAPSWNLFYWNWERSKPLASVSLADTLVQEQSHAGASLKTQTASSATSMYGPLVTSVAVCPGDALTVTLCGVGFLRFYKYTDGFLQQQPGCGYLREQQEIFLAHTWLDGERLVASTKRRAGLILLERGRFVGHVTVPRNPSAGRLGAGGVAKGAVKSYTEPERATITSIVATKNGFATGNSDGFVSVYEKSPNVHFHAGAAALQASSTGDEEEEEDGGGFSGLYDCLCTLQVPEREPGEPTDLAPYRDPNSVHSASGTRPDRLTEDASAMVGTNSALSIENTISGVVSATTRSGKPRRFHVKPSASLNVLRNTGSAANPARAAPAGAVAGHKSPRSEGIESSAAAADGGAGGAKSESLSTQDVPGSAVAARGHGVSSMAIDQGEETLAVLTNAGKIYALDYRQNWAQVQREIDHIVSKKTAAAAVTTTPGADASHGDSVSGTETSLGGLGGNMTGNTMVSLAGGTAKIPSFEPVCEPFHTGRINGMDTSVRKPFLITSSSDHSVRLWNTATHKMEMCVFFKEEPGAVALHPSGLMAVVCFPDSVRVMSVLWNSLRSRRIISFRNASDVSFSHGGQFFSVTHGNLVDIFHSATCEPHGQLRGHPQKVKDLKWCSTSPYPTDNSLITCSMDGMIMFWSSKDARKEAEHSDNKRYQYLAVAADDRYVWALGAPTSAAALEVQWKVTLREMDRHVLGAPNASSEDYEFTDTALTSLISASHQRMLFGGGEDGSLKAMSLPLPIGVQQAPLPAHAGSITRMSLSRDESTLFTAGTDGSIFVWEVRGGAGGIAAGAAAGASGMDGGTSMNGALYGTNEVLVTQQELEEQKVEMESLQHTVEKLKTDIDSEEKRRNHEQGTRMRERLEEFKGDAATLANEYAAVWNSKAEQERAFVAVKLEKEAEAAREMERTETARQSEVQQLEELCNDLQYTLEKEQTQHGHDLIALEERIEEEANDDKERYQDLVTQRKDVLEKLSRQVARARQTSQETLHQLELDTDAESQEVGGKHQRELNRLRERFLRMKGESAIMRKNATRMEREIDVRGGELRLLDSAKTALVAQLGELSQRMSQLHQDIDERDAVIGEKEKTIYALKKQNQGLEKNKFVLDHRIRQLKAQMEPKQREIMQHNQAIKSRNDELEALHENNLTLRASIESLKSDLTEQQQHTKQLLKTINDFETYKSRYLRDVGSVATVLQEPQQLRDVIMRLYTTHVSKRGGVRVAAADPQIHQEFKGQLEYLSTSVGALRKKVKADQAHHKKEVSAMMTENLALIKEIHSLRTEIQELRTVVACEEAARRSRVNVPPTGAGAGKKKRGLRSASGAASSSSLPPATRERPSFVGDSERPETDDARVEDVFNATADGTGIANSSSSAAAAATTTTATKSTKINPMPSSSAPHPHPPASSSGGTRRRYGSSSAATGAAAATASSPSAASAGGEKSVTGGGPERSSRAPQPPKAIEENRMELRMLRAYLEVLEKAMAATERPPSDAGTRLPPIVSGGNNSSNNNNNSNSGVVGGESL